MKTFLLDTLNKYKRISKGLDAKTILCNKSWQVFNNSGEKEIYIFQEDGSLIISLNGKAIIAKWSFIPANDTVLISHNESSYMMKPFFNDDNLFVLQLDGTNEYSFLIDETKKGNFPANTLRELEFHITETKRLEEEKELKAIEQKKIQEAEEKRKKLLEDVALKSQQEFKILNSEPINDKEPKVIDSSSNNKEFNWGNLILGVCLTIYIFGCIMVYLYENPEGRSFISVLINIKG